MTTKFVTLAHAQDADSFVDTFNAVVAEKVTDALEARKQELAGGIFGINEDTVLQSGTKVSYNHNGKKHVGTITGRSQGSDGISHTIMPHKNGEADASQRHVVHKSNITKVHADRKTDSKVGSEFRIKKSYVPEELELSEEYHKLSDTAKELVLHADNDSHLYRSSHEPIMKNLAKKHAKGVYDSEKAKKLWGYHADRAAQSYAKEHGDKHTPWHKMFTPEHRKEAAAHWEEHHREDLHESNNWSDHFDNDTEAGIPHEHTHQVTYTEKGVPGRQYFHCTADDHNHAAEQCADAYPEAKIHKIEPLKEESEQIDEVSDSTKEKYAKRAKSWIANAGHWNYNKEKSDKRRATVDKIEKTTKEEVEKVDEIGNTFRGRMKLKNYLNRAGHAEHGAEYDGDDHKFRKSNPELQKKNIKNAQSRLWNKGFQKE